MAFEKGMKKPLGSGVKKGQKQKPRVEKETIAEILANLNINVVHQLLKYTTSESKLPDKDKARIWMELMGYVYAKPRADMKIEVDNIEDQQKNVIVGEIGAKIIDAINKWHGK